MQKLMTVLVVLMLVLPLGLLRDGTVVWTVGGAYMRTANYGLVWVPADSMVWVFGSPPRRGRVSHCFSAVRCKLAAILGMDSGERHLLALSTQ